MRTLLVVFLGMNLLVEGFAAFALITGPGGLPAAGSGEQWSMHYGFAVIAIASASVWMWPWRNDRTVATAVLGILIVFHAAVFVSLAIAGDQQQGMIIHAILATVGLLLFSLRSRWTSAGSSTTKEEK